MNEEMEALEEFPEAAETGPGPAPAMAGMMVAGPMPAHKQLYQFLWAGIAVLFGCLLRFNCYAPGWEKATYDDALVGPIGFQTVGGSIVAFAAMLFIGAQLFCMKYRRVMLGPIVLMMLVAVWAWLRFTWGLGAENLGLTADVTEPRSWTAMFYNADTFVDFWSHLGAGILFILCGSTYVVLVFFGAILGLGGGKKKAAEESGPVAKGRGRRR